MRGGSVVGLTSLSEGAFLAVGNVRLRIPIHTWPVHVSAHQSAEAVEAWVPCLVVEGMEVHISEAAGDEEAPKGGSRHARFDAVQHSLVDAEEGEVTDETLGGRGIERSL